MDKHALRNPLVLLTLVCSQTFTAAPSGAQSFDNLDKPGDLLSRSSTKGVPVATVTLDALKAKLDRHERLFLVEVTDRKHFNRCHLPGAIALQLKDSRRKASSKLRDKKGEIVVYCPGFATDESDKLARDLVAQGYTDVRIYPGGAKEWISVGYSTEGSNPRNPDP